jgi:hypothetical protein
VVDMKIEGLKLKYFVLRPEPKSKNDIYARASIKAMRIYAEEIKNYDSKFYCDLKQWINACEYKLNSFDIVARSKELKLPEDIMES